MTIREKLDEIELSLLKSLRVIKEIRAEIPPSNTNPPISKEEYEWLVWELDGWPNIVKSIYEAYQINSLEDLAKRDLMPVKIKIKDIKKAYESVVE
jgi:hypothetical protein